MTLEDINYLAQTVGVVAIVGTFVANYGDSALIGITVALRPKAKLELLGADAQFMMLRIGLAM